jgi:hypothetical protein
MYGWLWRNLPGPWWGKVLMLGAAAAGVVALCFQFLFPWASPLLPFNNVTVEEDDGGTSTPPPSPVDMDGPPLPGEEELPGGDQPGDQQPTDEETGDPAPEGGETGTDSGAVLPGEDVG